MDVTPTVAAPDGSWSRITVCRACGASDLDVVLDLGHVPLADVFPTVEEAARPDELYPLSVAWCGTCSLLQTREDVPATTLFDDRYLYRSSSSPALVAAAKAHVRTLIDTRHLGPDQLVVEIASNDGYLLQHVVAAGVQTLGIDPVAALAAEARERGVVTLERFFTRDVADRLLAVGVAADVIIANNVLAHVEDLPGTLDAVAALLRPTGTARFEVPWALALRAGLAFDTTYHEHRCHFTVTALVPLFARVGLVLQHVDHLPVHGGSLRLHVGPDGVADDSVTATMLAERDAGLVDGSAWATFSADVDLVIAELRQKIDELVVSEGPLGAYGAAAKGSILANVVGLGTDRITWVADANTAKHGRLLPGVRVPIVGVDRLPDARTVVLLAWNVVDEVAGQQAEWLKAGGRFLVPLPTPRMVTG